MKTILVVEDNETNMYLISFILKKHNFQIIEASCGEEALKLVKTEKLDLIIIDIQLPDINGLEVTKRIRMEEKNKKIPIVALTSYALSGDREKALAAGCTGYIKKPINPEIFMAQITKFIE